MLCVTNIFPQTLPSPPWPITSDYGPRDVADSWFHYGVYYGGKYWADITPVEGGTIGFIEYGGGWDIQISGSHGSWEYLHIFKGVGSLPVTSENWELRIATLVNPDNPNVIKKSNTIILWSGQRSIKALCPQANYWIRNPDNSYVLGTDGERIRTRSEVSDNESIAPVGNSGGVRAHLHLELNDGADNPLLYVRHPPDVIPSAVIESPPQGKVFIEEELKKDFPIIVRVNSVNGLDFDRMDLTVYKNKDLNHPIHLRRSGTDVTFGYGGRLKEEKTDTIVETYGTTTGVQPIKPGEDRFVYLQNFGKLNLGKGSHLLVVNGQDVNGNEMVELKREFLIAGISSDVTVTSTIEYYRVEDYYGVVDEYMEELDYPVSQWGQEFTGSVFSGGYGRYSGEIFPGTCYDDVGKSFEVTNTYMEVSRYRINVTSYTLWEFSLLDCGGGHGVKYEGGPYDSIDEKPSDCYREITLDVDFRDGEDRSLGHYSGEIFFYDKREKLEVWMWDNDSGGYDKFGGVIPNPGFKPEEGMKLKKITVGELAKLAGVKDIAVIDTAGVTIGSTVIRSGRGPDMWVRLGINGIDFYSD